MGKDGPSIGGMAAVDGLRSRKVIMTVAEFAAQRSEHIRELPHGCHAFRIIGHRIPNQFLPRREGVFNATHRLLRIEQHARRHFMQYINQSFQTDNRLLIDDFFIAFAENDGARMPPHHADDVLRLGHAPDGRQLRLHIDAQLVAGVVERFGRTPRVAADEIETCLPQHAQIVQIFLRIKVRITCFRKIAMLRHTAEIDGMTIDEDSFVIMRQHAWCPTDGAFI